MDDNISEPARYILHLKVANDVDVVSGIVQSSQDWLEEDKVTLSGMWKEA